MRGSELPHVLSSSLFRLNCCSQILSMVLTANEVCRTGVRGAFFYASPPRGTYHPGVQVVLNKKKDSPLFLDLTPGYCACTTKKRFPPGAKSEGIRLLQVFRFENISFLRIHQSVFSNHFFSDSMG